MNGFIILSEDGAAKRTFFENKKVTNALYPKCAFVQEKKKAKEGVYNLEKNKHYDDDGYKVVVSFRKYDSCVCFRKV